MVVIHGGWHGCDNGPSDYMMALVWFNRGYILTWYKAYTVVWWLYNERIIANSKYIMATKSSFHGWAMAIQWRYTMLFTDKKRVDYGLPSPCTMDTTIMVNDAGYSWFSTNDGVWQWFLMVSSFNDTRIICNNAIFENESMDEHRWTVANISDYHVWWQTNLLSYSANFWY